MNIPPKFMFTKTDEWFDPATGKMGLTDYAQGQLSDIVFVEVLLSAGDKAERGKPIASVESVKAAAETYASASGKVVAVNEDLSGNPEVLNNDPYGVGWMIQIEGGDTTDLMDGEAYEKYCADRAH